MIALVAGRLASRASRTPRATSSRARRGRCRHSHARARQRRITAPTATSTTRRTCRTTSASRVTTTTTCATASTRARASTRRAKVEGQAVLDLPPRAQGQAASTSWAGRPSAAPTGFNHDLTGWPLKGKHAATECDDCHKLQATSRASRRTWAPTGCAALPRQGSAAQVRAQRDKLACERCHSESVWKPQRRRCSSTTTTARTR